jgi:hypothetical protein
MKRKCWLFCMMWISDILIYWGNGSKLKKKKPLEPQVFPRMEDFIPGATKMGDQDIWI